MLRGNSSRKTGVVDPGSVKRCAYIFRSVREIGKPARCEVEGQHVVYYGDGKRLRFCDDHFEAREEYRPASAEQARAAIAMAYQLRAGTHELRQRCRSCAHEEPREAKSCSTCGDTDLAPFTVPCAKRETAIGMNLRRPRDPATEAARRELEQRAKEKPLTPPA